MSDSTVVTISNISEIDAIRRQLLALSPESAFGRKLIELAVKGLDEGVERMSPAEISTYLGQPQSVFTACTAREGNGYVSQSPESGVASQGHTPGESLNNLREALALHFEVAPETIAFTPESERAIRLLEIIQSLDDSGIPKLSVEEIEEQLGRELGGIAEAYGQTGIIR